MAYKAYDPKKYKKRKKKIGVTVLIVIAILVIIAAAAAALIYNKQKNNIQALKYASDYSQDEINQKIEENDKETSARVSEFTGVDMRALTDEEYEMLQNGEISEEQAIAIVMGEADVEDIINGDYSASSGSADSAAGSEQAGDGGGYSEAAVSGGSVNTSGQSGSGTASASGSNSDNSSSESSGASSVTSADVNSTIAKIYVLKSEYTSSINSLISQGKSELSALSASGEVTNSAKLDLLDKYAGLGNELESSCDAKMETLLGELESQLNQTGGDTGIIDEIRSSYEQEKSLKKAELLSKYS